MQPSRRSSRIRCGNIKMQITSNTLESYVIMWKSVWFDFFFQVNLIGLVIFVNPLPSKRSPLEIGYVQFPLTHHEVHHPVHHHHHVTIHKQNLTNHRNNLVNSHEHWVPGHVVNHAFIPGHIEHVLVPAEHTLVVTHSAIHEVHAVVLHPVNVHPEVNIYRKHFGGYGVGVEYGGHGAGHGFQVA